MLEAIEKSMQYVVGKHDTMTEYVDAIDREVDRFSEMLEHFGGAATADFYEEKNSYGGNPTLIVKLHAHTETFTYKEMEWKINPASRSKEMAVNEIKAYFFDMLDGAFNL